MAAERRATVTRRRGGEQGEFAVRDLSISGMRLVGNLRLVEGERVLIAFELAGEQLQIEADVMRTEPQRAQVAVEFRATTAEIRAALARGIGTMIDQMRAASAASVLIVHDDAAARAELEREVLRLGHKATLCASVGETRDALAAKHKAILIGSSLPDAELRALLDQLVAEHPKMRRVLVFGEQIVPIDHAISSRIDAVLRTPWRQRPLGRALGIDSNDSSLALLLPEESK